ncbi:hypothetical protein J2X85_004080 [Microbacterium trichothecenolyticum]|nr:hypothetical protein [Microbacterium trichothecenolyticum]
MNLPRGSSWDNLLELVLERALLQLPAPAALMSITQLTPTHMLTIMARLHRADGSAYGQCPYAGVAGDV